MWDTVDNDNRARIARELLGGVTVEPKEVVFDYFYLPQFM